MSRHASYLSTLADESVELESKHAHYLAVSSSLDSFLLYSVTRSLWFFGFDFCLDFRSHLLFTFLLIVF